MSFPGLLAPDTIAVLTLMAKATLLLAVAFGAATLLQRAAAGARHLVWAGTLGAVLLLPAVSAWSPLRLALLPAPLAGNAAVPAASIERSQVQRRAADGTLPNRRLPETSGDVELSALPAVIAPAGDADEIASPGVWQLALVAWAVVAFALAGWLALGFLSVRRIIRRGTALTGREWSGVMFEIADRLGMDRAPRIVCSDEVHMPFAAGLLSPTIVLPAECTAWDAERRSAVLMHELAHIKRRDLLGHTLGRVACALYWFHPLVWSAARRLRIESERACDDLALTCGLRATNYAEHLLDIVTSVRRPMTPAVAIPMADRREFEGRMLAILDPDVRRRAGRGQSLALVGGLLAMAVVVGGAVPAQVAARAPDPAAVAGSADSMVASSERNVPDDDASIGRDEQYMRTIDSRVDRAMRSTVTSQKTSSRISGAANVEFEDDPSSGATSSAASLALDARLQSQGSDDRATMLITVLRTDSSAELRRVAAWGLRQYAERPEVSRALAEALRRDGETTVREMCAWALGDGRGDGTATAALIEALGRDRDPGVRESAAWALGSVGAETAGDALATAVRDASPRLRSTALWALGNLDHGAVPTAVIEALSDSSAKVRRLAAWVLHNREDAASVPAIERALARESDRAVRGALMRALGAMGEPASSALARLLDSSDADLRAAVVNALAGKGGGPWPLPMPRPRPFP